jgi:chemotaxis protein MotB
MNGAIRCGGVLLATALLAGCVSSGKFNKLKAEQATLQTEKTALETEKAALQSQYDQLTKDNATLKADIDKLKVDTAALTAERDSLSVTHQQTVSSYDAVVQQLAQEVDKGNLQVRQYKNMLSVDVAEQIFFDSGKATVKASGREVLKKVGEALGQYPEKFIRVVGHTDSIPLAKTSHMTNWELSTNRATNVVRLLQEASKIDPHRLIASGRAEFQPVATNATPEGRQKNRRIEIQLLDRSLVESIVGDQVLND